MIPVFSLIRLIHVQILQIYDISINDLVKDQNKIISPFKNYEIA